MVCIQIINVVERAEVYTGVYGLLAKVERRVYTVLIKFGLGAKAIWGNKIGKSAIGAVTNWWPPKSMLRRSLAGRSSLILSMYCV